MKEIYNFWQNFIREIIEDTRILKRKKKQPHFEYPKLIKQSLSLSGKKSKSVFDFLTYSRETLFSFSYGEVVVLNRPNRASNEIDRVS